MLVKAEPLMGAQARVAAPGVIHTHTWARLEPLLLKPRPAHPGDLLRGKSQQLSLSFRHLPEAPAQGRARPGCAGLGWCCTTSLCHSAGHPFPALGLGPGSRRDSAPSSPTACAKRLHLSHLIYLHDYRACLHNGILGGAS